MLPAHRGGACGVPLLAWRRAWPHQWRSGALGRIMARAVHCAAPAVHLATPAVHFFAPSAGAVRIVAPLARRSLSPRTAT